MTVEIPRAEVPQAQLGEGPLGCGWSRPLGRSGHAWANQVQGGASAVWQGFSESELSYSYE